MSEIWRIKSRRLVHFLKEILRTSRIAPGNRYEKSGTSSQAFPEREGGGLKLTPRLIRLGQTYPRRRAAATVLAAFLSFATTIIQGQEAVRMSMASAYAAETRHQTASTLGYYNLKLGTTAWRFGTGLGLEYSDNINNSPKTEGDFILRPQVNALMFLPVTDKNSLNLTLGGGIRLMSKIPSLAGSLSHLVLNYRSTFMPGISGSIFTTDFR